MDRFVSGIRGLDLSYMLITYMHINVSVFTIADCNDNLESF